MNPLRQYLLEARALIETGWVGDKGFLALTHDGVPTFQNGHRETIPNSQKKSVSKHAVFIEEVERKNDDGKVTLFSTYYFPPAKWSLTGALMNVTAPDSLMPVKAFGDLCRLLEPFLRPWTFSFGERTFHYISHFDMLSEGRTEIVDGKKVKVVDRCTIDDVLRLIDCGISVLDLRDGIAAAQEVVRNAGVTLDPRIAAAYEKLRLNSELPLVANNTAVFYDPELANQITKSGQEILKAMTDNVQAMTDTESVVPAASTRATIAMIENVADLGENLSVYTVLGNRVVGMKEDGAHRFRQGEYVVYIPEGMIIPEEHLKERGYWDEEKNRGLLDGGKRNRVKKRNFLGIPSIGLIWKISQIAGLLDVKVRLEKGGRVHLDEFSPGDDVTDFFGLVMHGA